MTFAEWLSAAITRLQGGESPKRDAEILLQHVTGKSRSFVIAFGETPLTAEQTTELDLLLSRREQGEPIAYLVGVREFWSLPLQVSPATLIPRPDTERLVELALARLPEQPASLLDLGTGTGAIALALAHERSDCLVWATDIRPEAIDLATANASLLGIQTITFLTGSWYAPVKGLRFAMIVSNPPYIDEQDPHLQQGDVRFEPTSALVASEQGLADIRHIIQEAPQHLLENGWLLIEHGWQQGVAVRQLFGERGFCEVSTQVDYAGNDRVTLGQWPASSADEMC